MSDRHGNPDRFVTVEAITDWMDEMVKRGDYHEVYKTGTSVHFIRGL